MAAPAGEAGHRGVEDRLGDARRDWQQRQPCHPVLAAATLPALHARNLAAAPGVEVRVDSFLSSRNSDCPADAYPPLHETRLDAYPAQRRGFVRIHASSYGPDIVAVRLLDEVGDTRGVPTGLVRVRPGRSRITAAVEHASGRLGPPATLELDYEPSAAWPQGLEIREVAQGRLPETDVELRIEAWAHPELAAIRDELGAAALVARCRTDLERALVLRDWIKGLWVHEVARRPPPYNGRLIIDRAMRGVDTFICMHYSVALVHACTAVGVPARVVNLHRNVAAAHTYELGTEATVDPPLDEHVTAEVWSSELGKWVMVDTDFACHYELDGVALSAWEIHRALLDGRLDDLDARKGPGAEAYADLGEDFYPRVLPTYYRHVSILMRSDFISDPDGPVPVLHLTDGDTPPILWHDGDDLRLHTHLMGPMIVAARMTDRTGVLTDGSVHSAWCSADAPGEHWVEIDFPEPVDVRGIVLVWPEIRHRFATSQGYRILARTAADESWRELHRVDQHGERPWSAHPVQAAGTVGLRIIQPPGAGSPHTPDRLWLEQVEVLGVDLSVDSLAARD